MGLLSIERVVALLTPLVFAPLSALVTKWIAINIPGLHVTSGQLTALQISAIAGAIVMGAHWLHGRQIWTTLNSDYTKLPQGVRDEVQKMIGAEVAKLPASTTPTQPGA